MRAFPALFAIAMFAVPAFADTALQGGDALQGGPLTVEDNTYRFGDLYHSERGTTVEACAQKCTADQSCASWSLTPATFRMGPRCELKRTPGEAISRPGATSGMSEFWQMDPARHAAMRYQPSVPASRQPAAVPLDQLRPSPVPRTFGDPPPIRAPELMGAPGPQAAVQPKPVKAVALEAPTQTVQVHRAPGEGVVPGYVKQPAPQPAQPVYQDTERQAPKPVFKDPARKAPKATPVAANLNAVVKRQSQALQPAPTPVAAQAPAPAPAPEPQRVPWTERTGTTPNYSVGGSGYVPGDEDATAGFVEGVPEAGT
jgi:hypothetical protein